MASVPASEQTAKAPDLVTPSASLADRFEKLAATWRTETRYLSNSTVIAEHPAYQEIIRMGPPAVPLILRSLDKQVEHWFWALHAITRANPVTPEDRGKIDRMASAWLRWGKANGYHW